LEKNSTEAVASFYLQVEAENATELYRLDIAVSNLETLIDTEGDQVPLENTLTLL